MTPFDQALDPPLDVPRVTSLLPFSHHPSQCILYRTHSRPWSLLSVCLLQCVSCSLDGGGPAPGWHTAPAPAEFRSKGGSREPAAGGNPGALLCGIRFRAPAAGIKGLYIELTSRSNCGISRQNGRWLLDVLTSTAKLLMLAQYGNNPHSASKKLQLTSRFDVDVTSPKRKPLYREAAAGWVQ